MSNKRAQSDKKGLKAFLQWEALMSASCRRQAPNPRQNKSDLIESLLSETALNTREINPADQWPARDRC